MKKISVVGRKGYMPRLDVPLEGVLELTIEEQRRVYDWISKGYDQLRLKLLTILGGGLGALTFLYSSGELFIPTTDVSGKIFYFFGLAMTLGAVGVLIVALKPLDWEFPTENKDIAELDKFETRYDYLVYIKDRYQICYEINISAYNYKQKLFNYALYPLIFGIIILVVLKLF